MSFYVLSKAGDTFINVESFEYVYVADDDTIKAIAGQRMVRLGKYTNRECAETALQMRKMPVTTCRSNSKTGRAFG